MSLGVCESKLQQGLDFPIGWYSVARGNELGVGEVKQVYSFDRELALFRTRSGIAVVTDAFCPHLGAHLGVEGRVVGETIRCPFHGWRYGTDGRISKRASSRNRRPRSHCVHLMNLRPVTSSRQPIPRWSTNGESCWRV